MTSLKRRLPAVARIALGLVFFVFGMDGFLHLIPPPAMGQTAGAFLAALSASGFVMLLVKGVEAGAGFMLLSNRFVPLALTMLAPVIVGIVGFHVVLARASAGIAVVVLVLELYLAYVHRAAFAPLLGVEPRQSDPGRP